MRRSIWTRGSVQFGLLLLLSAAVFGLRLGDGGLWATEGHRALPAFAMHESGDWLVPRLFEQPYLRKPPGIQWLMQAGIELFGDSPFAARAPVAVCATLMVLVAWRFGRLWFGPRGGLASGLAMLLMPWVWPAARAAEIETLNNLGTQLAAMALLHVAVMRGGWRAVLLGGLGIFVCGVAKGPASLAVLGGVVAGSYIAGGLRWWSAVIGLGVAFALGVVATAVAFGLTWSAASGLDPVTQSPGEFLFELETLGGILLLPIAAFVASLPASLALLFPWGPDARAELTTEKGRPHLRLRLARALAWSWILALVLSMAAGLSNVRYAMPGVVLLPPLVGYVAWAWPRVLMEKRRLIARAMVFGHPAVLGACLLAGAVVWIGIYEPSRRATSGEQAGRAMGTALAGAISEAARDEIVLAADEAVEARPETLDYARRVAAREGVMLRFVWTPDGVSPVDAEFDGVVVRSDPDLDEDPASLINAADLVEVWSGEVHKFRYRVLIRRDLIAPDN